MNDVLIRMDLVACSFRESVNDYRVLILHAYGSFKKMYEEAFSPFSSAYAIR